MKSKMIVHQAVHGYARGHELLAASCKLNLVDADEMLRISDLSGSPVSSTFKPYLTLYPLPSETAYCVAKTWLDPDATRDGCVLTHTIILPMDLWRSGISATQLSEIARFPDRSSLGQYAAPLELADELPFSVSDHYKSAAPEIQDFAARFFVLDRTPVIWPISDGLQDSETVSLRTADFLWPSARARFAVCTYSLQPRFLVDRSFELMFVPRGAMGRFSAIPEANIVSSMASDLNVAEARDSAVAEVVTQSLLGEQNPVWEMLRRFGKELPSDRDALTRLVRIVELERQAVQNPKAYLAALDLWMALAPSPEMAVDSKISCFNKAMASAQSLEPAANLEYLSSLAQRLRRPPMQTARKALRQLGPDMEAATRRDPIAAVDLLSSLKRPPAVLVSAASRTLLETDNPKLMDYVLKAVAPEIGRKLLTYSPALASRAFTFRDDDTVSPEALDKLNNWLKQLSPRLRRNLFRILLHHPAILSNDKLAAATIDAATEDDLYTVLALPRNTHWPLGAEAARAILDQAHRDTNRAGIYYSENGIEVPSDVILCTDIVSNPSRLLSIVETGTSAGRIDLAGMLLLRGLKRGMAKDLSIDQMLRTFSLLASTDQLSDEVLLPLIHGFPSELALDLPINAFATGGASRSATAARIKAFDAALFRHLGGQMPLETFRKWLGERDRSQQFTKSEVSGLSKSILAAADKRPAADTWQSLVEISSFLVRANPQSIPGTVREAFEKTRSKLDSSSATAWILFIRAIESRYRQIRLESYVLSVRLAMLVPRKPLGAIAVECFPVFYKNLPSARQSFRLLDPFGLFDEPDRRKDARHELVAHFLTSDWNPADLALTAQRTGIIKKIVERLMNVGQRRYIDRMIERLKTRGQNDLAREVSETARAAKA